MGKQELEQRARHDVDAIADHPRQRLKMREDFYAKHGDAQGPHGHGLGNSELAFLNWEIRRGVLGGKPGTAPSAWWRAVNADFLYFSHLADLAWDEGFGDLDWDPPVRAWLDYLALPSDRGWYRAHNASILAGYAAHTEQAKLENPQEQTFINIVLYRVLFAQALVQDATVFGDLGEVVANPRLPAVDALVQVPAFYPEHYPLTPRDMVELNGDGHTLASVAVNLLDDLLIAPHLERLYAWAAEWDEMPSLPSWLTAGKPSYPIAVAPPEPVQRGPKRKIAILGGGISSLAAAWELTSYPDWQKDYDITLYQQGWRLGGKMAGGRGVHGRHEELGLHLLLGFYINAFPMFEQVYAERTARNLAPDTLYKKLQDAIVPNNGTLLVSWDAKHGQWTNWPLIFPPCDGFPGDGPALDTWQLLERGIAILLETVLGSPYANHMNPLVQWLLDRFFPKNGGAPNRGDPQPGGLLDHLKNWASTLFGGVVGKVEDEVATLLHRIGLAEADFETDAPTLVRHMLKILRAVYAEIEEEAVDARGPLHDIGRLLILSDFGLALMAGLFADVWNPTTGKFEYRAVNHLDFRVWLRKHGACDTTLYSPMVTFFYTGTFEALADHNDGGGLLAAGTALQFAIPAIGYKGSFCYQLRLGTADTLIMPLYEVLAARGVKFEFFHKVKSIDYTSDEKIERIQVERQVKLNSASYDPRVVLHGTPCWRNAPDYSQIDAAQAQELQARKVDLESPWTDWQGGEPLTLALGTDFDEVILGIPAKALAQCAPQILAKKQDWRDMVANIRTAQVMSAQLWFKDDIATLGYDAKEWGMGEVECVANVVTYANPLFSWLDSTQIIATEDWPAGKQPKFLAMFTGILPDELEPPDPNDVRYRENQVRRVRELTWQWLMDNMGWFLKKATSHAYPTGVDPALLRGLGEDTDDARRKFLDQYFAAAVAPSDQYVIAVPNTEQYRLRPDGSGFENLWLVGDWTDYGTNIGYMEGCVVSAHKAVRALRAAGGKLATRRLHIDTLADWS